MLKASMHFAYYWFLLTFCIDKGDGRWKKMDRENLQRDINLYKIITERVEHELQEYYAEYENHHLFQLNVNRNYDETKKNMPKAKLTIKNGPAKKKEPFLSRLSKMTNNIPIYNQNISVDRASSKEIINTRVKSTDQNTKWPKFEDMLLAIGKKYDWKNDRWIKVKEKFKVKDKNYGENDNSINFHEKHRFSYRTIKLNRGKNKRNVVIAVTAIR